MTATHDPAPPKAIETHYAGYRFRSRLEARWAVFFDAIGSSWQYEPQGYDLDGVRYLPDFLVVSSSGRWRYFVEVKGDLTADLSKPVLLSARQQMPVLIAGDIPRPGCDGPDAHLLNPSCYDAGWPELFKASFLPINEIGYAPCPFGWPRPTTRCDELWLTPDLAESSGWVKRPRKIDDAYKAARGARFEHGETRRQPKLGDGVSGEWLMSPDDARRAHFFSWELDMSLCGETYTDDNDPLATDQPRCSECARLQRAGR